MFEYIVWTGAAVSVTGLLGLIWCIVKVARARRQKLDDEALRAAVQSVLPYNLGALLLSVLGLMLVMVGIFLG
ncbi:hypothetical protein [Leisingera sp. S232]|uniref:hypothetical protein n=1 Tax=Leisingera sp. S232 TaxID=3415132 RepID=UPI00086CBB79|nr:hypothetical protein AB838_03925 [Rhodobacteraceae bacterium (ex Bugula neritina AB1)]